MEVLFATASRGGKMRQRNEMNVLNAGLYSTSGEFLYMSDSNQKLVANQIGGSLGKYKNNKYSSSGGGGGGGGGGNDGTNEQIGTLKFPKLVKQALKTTGAKSRLVKDLPSLNELSRKPESFANMVDSGNTTSNNVKFLLSIFYIVK